MFVEIGYLFSFVYFFGRVARHCCQLACLLNGVIEIVAVRLAELFLFDFQTSFFINLQSQFSLWVCCTAV
jgi:hypothetical protein